MKKLMKFKLKDFVKQFNFIDDVIDYVIDKDMLLYTGETECINFHFYRKSVYINYRVWHPGCGCGCDEQTKQIQMSYKDFLRNIKEFQTHRVTLKKTKEQSL